MSGGDSVTPPSAPVSGAAGRPHPLGRFGRIGVRMILLALLADQVSKWAVLRHFESGLPSVHVLPVFNLVLAWNPGITWSLFNGGGRATTIALTVVALAISSAMLVWMRRAGRRWEAAATGMVVGGAIGNVLDRVRYGAVVDFLDFHLGAWHYPVFNIADSCIVVGMLLLVGDGLLGRRPQS